MRKEPPANSSDDDPTRRRVVGRESPQVSSPKARGEEAAGSGAEPESLNFEDLGLFEGGFVFSPGEVVATRFRIVRFLATGGMGELYEAEDLELHERVALKTILPQIAANERSILMFMREVHLARQVTHPNVCRIFDVYRHRPELAAGAEGQAPEVVFLAMELLKGETLADRLLRERRLTTAEALPLVRQMAAGLSAAHRVGVVHRDFKTLNVMLVEPTGPDEDVRAVITDFGLAKRSADDNRSSLSISPNDTGEIAGTPNYMAPEQVEGGPVTPATDVYALGVVVFEMITGVRPFVGDTPFQTAVRRLQEPPPSPRAHLPDLDVRWEATILRCLARHPADRFASPADVVAALEGDRAEMRVDPQGLPRDTSGQAAAASESRAAGAASTSSRRGLWIGAGGAALVLALGAASWLGRDAWRSKGQAGARATGGTQSIAVLPFVDMSQAKDQEYFADGLTEELLNTLAQIQELRVAGRTSSFQFKGKNEDLRVIGQKLNVEAILEGSVRKAGSRVRITAQLVKVADGFHLWSETYDRELDDIFAVQAEISRSVSSALELRLLAGRGPPTAVRGNAEAYNLYLQGKYFVGHQSREHLEKAVSFYEQALKLDPGYARAWTGLANAHSAQADRDYIPLDEGRRKARREVEKALELDPNLADAHAALGRMRRVYDWDWSGADAAYMRALELEPGGAAAVRGLAGQAATLGRFEEALRLDRRGVAIDPLSAAAYVNLGRHAWRAGRLDEAEVAFRKALDLNPDSSGAHQFLGRIQLTRSKPEAALEEMEREKEPAWHRQGLALAYHALRRKKEADAALAEVVEKDKETWAFQIAEIYSFRGERDEAFSWLERAYASRDGGLSEIKGDPLLRNLEADPRYPAFLKKMRLPL